MASSKGRNRRHAHLKKRPANDGFKKSLGHKFCDTCGKHCYLTRDEAKQAATILHPGTVMHFYDCTEPSGRKWFHFSSIPASKLKVLRERKAG